MHKEIIVNATLHEVRVAIMENGILSELFVERRKELGILGNIYKGKVIKVLPGMQAAFVDVGLPKAGFLYVADIQDLAEEYESLFPDEPGAEAVENGLEGDAGRVVEQPRIEEMLREGQEILVQVAKEPLGTKGARLTNRVSLPGRSLVYMPGEEHIGISRRIADETERERLRALIAELKPPQGGLIVRTAGEGALAEEFRQDLNFLLALWQRIREKSEKCHAPHLVHSDLDLLLKTVRDHLTEGVQRLLIDNAEDYQRLAEFTSSYLPHLRDRIELYQKQEPIFDSYDIELDIGRLLERKVWLKSGGYIAIDSTEALVTVDVNTGKYVGRENFEETILKTNLEAAREIAYQLRLRNLGGILIIDFIDMEKEKNRERVVKTLEEGMRTDRATSKVLQISELGLVEMTRKRNRPPLEKTLCLPCPHCKGKGQIKSPATVGSEIFREILRVSASNGMTSLLVTAHPAVADTLLEEERQLLEHLERTTGRSVVIKADPALHHEAFTVVPMEPTSRE